jgi:hypothetical protein
MKKSPYFIRLTILLLLICVALFLGGCITAKQKKLDAGMKPLVDQELKYIFSSPIEGKFVSSKNGMITSLHSSPDGSQTFSNPKLSDNGTWRIADGEQCSRWKKVREGSENCFTWFKIADDTYELYQRNGSKHGVFTIK